MADAIKKGASLNPADFIAGGLLDDVDATWKNVKFEMYDYEGKADKAPCLAADMVTGTELKPEDIVRQRWSCGSAENWEPSPDGLYLTPIGSDTELRKASNMYLLMTSLHEAGFPDALLSEGCAANFEGLKAHMRRKEGPKRGNLPQQQTRRVVGGKEYERDNKILLVEKILELPKVGAQDEAPKKGKKAAKEEAPKQEASGGDVDVKAKDLLTSLILSGGGKANKKDIPAAGFKMLATDPDRNKILALLFKEEWIAANGFVVSADGVITLG